MLILLLRSWAHRYASTFGLIFLQSSSNLAKTSSSSIKGSLYCRFGGRGHAMYSTSPSCVFNTSECLARVEAGRRFYSLDVFGSHQVVV